MTNPSITLAHVLETAREVRAALAYVPQLSAERKFQEAHDVIDDCSVQLRELWPVLDQLARDHGGQTTLEADGLVSAVERLASTSRTLVGGSSPRPLSGPEPLPRANPDIGFADQPLW